MFERGTSMTRFSKSAVALTSIASFAFSAMAIAPARADDGITPTEVVIGGTDPFSGPASAYGAVGKGSQAYFQYINDHGGVNGRKITYKDLDDGLQPAANRPVDAPARRRGQGCSRSSPRSARRRTSRRARI